METPKLVVGDTPIMASQGGLDVLVDPYNESTSGELRITALKGCRCDLSPLEIVSAEEGLMGDL